MSGKYHRRTTNEEKSSRNGLKKITAVLSFIVVVATVSALTLPAITMNRENCNLEEHTHTDECYTSSEAYTLTCDEEALGVHKHESACFSEDGTLICNIADYVFHTHNESCVDESSTLVCSLPVVEAHMHSDECYVLTEADLGHIHTDECYNFAASADPLCGLEEAEAHIHEDECYEFVMGELLCEYKSDTITPPRFVECSTEPDESGDQLGEADTQAQEILTEDPEHTHTDECYAWNKTENLICTITESEEHTHKEECFPLVKGELNCTEEEREPSEAKSALVCEKNESFPHTHSETCEADCTVPEAVEHIHSESCFTADEPDLICTVAEHIHTEECGAIIEPEVQLTDEEIDEIDDVIFLIDILPSMDEIEAKLFELTDDELLSYEAKVITQIKDAENSYNALSDEQKALVTNAEKLNDYADFIAEDPYVRDINYKINGLPTSAEVDEKYSYLSESERDVYIDDILAQIYEIKELYLNLSEEQQLRVPDYLFVLDLEEYLVNEEYLESIVVEDIFECYSDGYTTTVSAPLEANLPEDTVLNATPLFNYDEDDGSSDEIFATLTNSSESAEKEIDYKTVISNAITWGDVSGIHLFDVTLTSHDEEVQPDAPVDVTTTLPEPITLSDNEVIYGLHFGEDGVEITPAYTERDGDGRVISVTHTQTSFSPSGYTLVHVDNPTDKGPDTLPVHYCIWVNDQWIIAGSSRTGWYGNYTSSKDWTTNTRDYITLEQLGSVLGEYGLNQADDETEENYHRRIWSSIWYQRAEDAGKTIRHDTYPTQKEIDGEMTWIFPLSGNMLKDDGYHIYYVPEGTKSGSHTSTESTYSRNKLLGEDLAQNSKFYSMTVRDMNNIVYTESEKNNPEIFPQAKIYQYGTPVEVTVRTNNKVSASNPDGTNMYWMWVNDKGNYVHGYDGKYTGPVEGLEFGYTDNLNGTETYTLNKISGRTTLIPYSRAVNDAEQSTEKQVDIAVFLDGKWQKVGQLNLMYRQNGVCLGPDGEPMWFVTAGQVYTILKDFGFQPETYAPNDEENIGHVFTHAKGAFDENGMKMAADGVNQVLRNTVAIGLGHYDANESTNDGTIEHYTLFYLPGSSNEKYNEVHGVDSNVYAEGDLIQGDRFYSVKIVDDYQLVYYGYETENFRVYASDTVSETNPLTVSVQNNLSVLWSIDEPWSDTVAGYVKSEYTVEASGNFNVYTFTEINGPIEIEASSLNPSFTVQYYANIERYQLFDVPGDGTIPLINTSDGNGLPTNDGMSEAYDETVDPSKLKHLQLTPGGLGLTPEREDSVDDPTRANAGDRTQLYKVATYTDNARIYTEEDFIFDKAHNWINIDKLHENDNYKIEAIWILKEGMDPNSVNEDDWWIYHTANNASNISFTNIASEETAPRQENADYRDDRQYKILITEGMVMRLHYELESGLHTEYDVKFYDYDISSDRHDVGQQGINSYINGEKNITGAYGFGNSNCFTGMGAAKWGNQRINQYNRFIENKIDVHHVYKGCTFGLVKGINDDGSLRWAEGIKAPTIFGSSTTEVVGREDYVGQLDFSKRGDVYTLVSSTVANSTRTNLNLFFNPSPVSGTTHTHIFTNNFWVMDGAPNDKRKDGLWGEYGVIEDIKGYNDYGIVDSIRVDNKTYSSANDGGFPQSDDGNAHNSFFGMNFSVEFPLPADYVGPMEYIFFGDDDMWVFLERFNANTQQYETLNLICDIGGVHSAVGQYVNLRDYLPDGTSGQYRMSFYYTERGASGSTCWMSFTLPVLTSSITEAGTSQLQITKSLYEKDGTTEVESDEEFEFTIQLYTDADKQTIVNRAFSVQINRADNTVNYQTTSSGKTLKLGAGDTATILGIPIGTYYVIEEKGDARFDVEVHDKKGNIAEGLIFEGTAVEGLNSAEFKNILIDYRLPDTGGIGTSPFIWSGVALMGAAVLIYSRKQKHLRRETK